MERKRLLEGKGVSEGLSSPRSWERKESSNMDKNQERWKNCFNLLRYKTEIYSHCRQKHKQNIKKNGVNSWRSMWLYYITLTWPKLKHAVFFLSFLFLLHSLSLCLTLSLKVSFWCNDSILCYFSGVMTESYKRLKVLIILTKGLSQILT